MTRLLFGALFFQSVAKLRSLKIFEKHLSFGGNFLRYHIVVLRHVFSGLNRDVRPWILKRIYFVLVQFLQPRIRLLQKRVEVLVQRIGWLFKSSCFSRVSKVLKHQMVFWTVRGCRRLSHSLQQSLLEFGHGSRTPTKGRYLIICIIISNKLLLLNHVFCKRCRLLCRLITKRLVF